MSEHNFRTTPYKFRCSLLGHSKDVRSIVCPSEQLALSGSRDFTARTWLLSIDSPHGVPQMVLRGHENYVSSVAAYVDPSGDPQLFTGSHDKIIRAYISTQSEPLYQLHGHDDNVCSLATGPDGILVSGSWDKSVKIWKNRDCVLTIRGHEAAVWCVLLLPQSSISTSTASTFILITGSADRTIKLWNVHGLHQLTPEQPPSHALLKTLTGHSDCVRSLARLDADRILSASNDASIRAWHVATGECVGEFYGHTSFVYSIGTQPKASVFVSSGEDRCVRVWAVPANDQWGPGKHFDALQCIPLPCQSIWCVALTPRLDILAGGSDSSIRVFSRDPSRQASPEHTEVYEAELSSAKITTTDATATGDLDLEKLPGIEALLQPGKREGHVIVINQDGRRVCYQWSASETRWLEVGDVVGTGNSKLPVYNGKEYDFVFSVDVSEQMGPLKLPYNRTEDPWVVAQRFIHEHDLPQDYLDTVAQFIIRNAGPQLEPSVFPTDNSLCDPFTGADRYVPPSMYNPPKPKNSDVCYFPSTTFIPLKSISLNSLLVKLESFNRSESQQNQLSPAHLDLLRNFTFELSEKQATDLTGALLETVAKWPMTNIFPLLDVLRCLTFWPAASSLIFSDTHWKLIYSCSLNNSELPQANCLLVLRLLANALASDGPVCLGQSDCSGVPVPQSIITAVSLAHDLDRLVHNAEINIAERKPHQIALAAYIHNLSVFSHLVAVSQSELPNSIRSKVPHLTVVPSLSIRIGLSILSLAPDHGTGGVTLFHPDAVFTLLLAVGTALITASLSFSVADPEAIKTHRVRLIASAATSATLNGDDSGSVEELAAAWDNVRRILTYWAHTPTCLPKVRGCAMALLHLLE